MAGFLRPYVSKCFSRRKLHVGRILGAKYNEGDSLHGYTVKKVKDVENLNLTAVWLTHDKTGAQHLHVDRQDEENVFGVAFRTTPMDSTGVPHILEHTALCGSNRYPVRDPFFKMLNRSLATFMNAFTASDWTMYPFSTQNHQDFKNLMSVYMDAAFFPKLTEADFRQEGWRLEHERPEDKSSPLVFKGVVYNEMKGVFSDSRYLYQEALQNALRPSHTYSVCSGGKPSDIINLTWQQLQDFHQSHYHPSNSRFFTYGTFPLDEHLQQINEDVLSKFTAINPGTEVPVEKFWNQSREVNISCASDPLAPDQDKQTTVSVSYLLPDITDIKSSFVLSILSELLVSGEKSPFYESLIEPNIGSDFSVNTGYDRTCRNASFSVGIQGIHKDDIELVKMLIEQTIDKTISKGFEPERLEALLHRIELSLKHQYSKFGLNLLLSAIYYWNHDADPTELLDVSTFIESLKASIAKDPKHLQRILDRYIMQNPHKLTFIMSPEDDFELKRQKEEIARLNTMVSALGADDKQIIYDKGLELQRIQSTDEDISCLPTLKVTDIPEHMKYYSHTMQKSHDTDIQISEQPTNGVTYFRALLNAHGLPDHLLPYLPLFTNILTKMGASDLDYREFSQQVELYTGGMDASCHVQAHHTKSDLYQQGVVLSSFCLDKNAGHMWDLWEKVFNQLILSDNERLTTLIQMSALELSQNVAQNGHVYAMCHACSGLSAGARLNENLHGLTQVKFMSTLAEAQDLSPVVDILKQIAGHLLNRNNMSCSISASPEGLEKAVRLNDKFLSNLSSFSELKQSRFKLDPDFQPSCQQTHFELPVQVNFVGKCFATVPYTHQDYGSLRILARLMTNKYLHREIREKGGAYGGGAKSNENGAFQFYSYRDPHFLSTLKAFTNAVEWAGNGKFTQQDIDEAKLAIFAQVDSPVSPGERGNRHFLSSITDELVQKHRENLFNVNKESLIRVTESYLQPTDSLSSACLLGAENSSTRDNPDWEVLVENKQGTSSSHMV